MVLILGTNYNGLDHNEDFINQTIEFYTPTATGSNNKAKFKGKEYDIQNGHITVEDKELAVGELAVYLYFKGHPAYPANSELQQYFEQKHITVLPHRTPVEVLFWLYDVKVGGYESTSFLSCTQGQAEFFYIETANGEMKNTSLKQMQDAGFFSNAAIFKNS